MLNKHSTELFKEFHYYNALLIGFLPMESLGKQKKVCMRAVLPGASLALKSHINDGAKS